MWDQNLFELFTNIIPQGLAFILIYFSLTNIKIKLNSLLGFGIGLGVITFLIRPYVNFGVHTVVMMFLLVLIAVLWGKSDIIMSVIYSIVTFTTGYFCEWVTFIFLSFIKFDLQQLDSNAHLRVLIGSIPLIMLFLIGLIIYFSKNKKVKLKEDIKNDVV